MTRMKRMARFVLPVGILAVGAGGMSHLISSKPRLEPSPSAERVWTVDAVTVSLDDVQPEIRLFGRIFAAREIQLRALVPGQVVEVHPELVEGGLVRRGETILAIDEFEYRSALKESEARLAEAKARLAELEARRAAEAKALEHDWNILALLVRDLERAERLSARGILSDKALDDKRLELVRQERAVELRRNGVAAEAARLEQQNAIVARLDVAARRARYDLERTRLRAPFDGVLRDTAAQVGQRLGVNDKVGGLIDTSRLEARFLIPDAEYGRLAGTDRGIVGRTARVIWRAGRQKLRLDAVIQRVGARIDPGSGGVELFARIDDGDAAASLRPGAFVEILVRDRSYAMVARVPETVLRPGDVAYGIEDGRIVPRQTEIVGRVGNDVLLRGDLSDGERVITTRSAAIVPGLRVEAR